ncbi:MAG: hypothetical protein AAFX56_09440 [Pseudomonadota bacterium]
MRVQRESRHPHVSALEWQSARRAAILIIHDQGDGAALETPAVAR